MGLSQQALAERFNLSQQSIHKYENGLAEPDIHTLKGFAQLFGVTIDYLVGLPETPDKHTAGFMPTPQEVELLRKLRCIRPDIRQDIENLLSHL